MCKHKAVCEMKMKIKFQRSNTCKISRGKRCWQCCTGLVFRYDMILDLVSIIWKKLHLEKCCSF